MATKKPVTKTAPTAASAKSTTAAKPAIDVGALPAFPRHMKLVNETAQPWVIGGAYVPPGSEVKHRIRDEDALKRARADCRFVLSVSDHYKPEDGADPSTHALRVIELDDAPPASETDGAASTSQPAETDVANKSEPEANPDPAEASDKGDGSGA